MRPTGTDDGILQRTLDELEGTWTPLEDDERHSHLVTTCHRLRRKPLADMTAEDLRILVGQNLGLTFLVPVALAWLEREPLLEGDLYPADLLSSVLAADGSFWASQPELRDRVVALLAEIGDPSIRTAARRWGWPG